MISDGIDFEGACLYAIPMVTRFRGITVREEMLIEGPAGWDEFSPFRDYDDRAAAGWLATAVEAATVGFATTNGGLPAGTTHPPPDPTLLGTHKSADRKQSAWWRERLRRVHSELTRLSTESGPSALG